MTEDYEELLGCFDSHGVEYLVVGAHALAFHAKPRFTKDLDLFVAANEDNAAHLLAALEDFGFGSLGLTVEDFTKAGHIIQLGVAPSRIDLLTSLSGVDFADAWRARVLGRLGSHEAPFLCREHLIASKRAAGRPQDLVDLSWLEDASNPER